MAPRTVKVQARHPGRKREEEDQTRAEKVKRM